MAVSNCVPEFDHKALLNKLFNLTDYEQRTINSHMLTSQGTQPFNVGRKQPEQDLPPFLRGPSRHACLRIIGRQPTRGVRKGRQPMRSRRVEGRPVSARRSLAVSRRPWPHPLRGTDATRHVQLGIVVVMEGRMGLGRGQPHGGRGCP